MVELFVVAIANDYWVDKQPLLIQLKFQYLHREILHD
jgi:hypothetical protein